MPKIHNFGHKIVPEGLKRPRREPVEIKRKAILATKPNRSISFKIGSNWPKLLTRVRALNVSLSHPRRGGITPLRQKFTTERAEIDMHLSFPQNAFSLTE